MSDIKLKPIKPGMVIHCPTEQEANQLIKWAYKSGWHWNGGTSTEETSWEEHQEETCYKFYEDNSITYAYTKYFVENSHRIIEFSDLIELTAEEALKWIGKHYFDDEYTEIFGNYDISDIIKVYGIEEFKSRIARYKAEHGKKEPEVEWHYFAQVYGKYSTSNKNCETEKEAIGFIEEELRKVGDNSYYGKYEHICKVNQ